TITQCEKEILLWKRTSIVTLQDKDYCRRKIMLCNTTYTASEYLYWRSVSGLHSSCQKMALVPSFPVPASISRIISRRKTNAERRLKSKRPSLTWHQIAYQTKWAGN